MALDRPRLLALSRLLGGEFRRRGMEVELRLLRMYYLVLSRNLDQGGRVAISWSAEMIEEWLAVLQVAPFDRTFPVRPPGSACLRCGPTERGAGGPYTQSVWPGGAKIVCRTCNALWLEVHP